MKLVLIRHGIAEDLLALKPRPGALAARDADRRLTELGRRRVRRVAAALAQIGLRPDVVVHSGLVRARETAELIAKRIRPHEPELVVVPELEPDAEPEGLFARLGRLRMKKVVAVGHAPNVDRVFALALGTEGRIVTAFGKAGAACFELPDSGRPAGRLVWFLPPKLLRRLA